MRVKRLLTSIIMAVILFMIFSCVPPFLYTPIGQAVNGIVDEYNLEEEDYAAVFYLGDLKTGDTVTENAPQASSKTFDSITAQEPSYLFMIDYAPRARFGHEVKYVIVSKTTGQIADYMDAEWTPLVNGTSVEGIENLYDYDPGTWKWYKPSWIKDVEIGYINWEDFAPYIPEMEVEGAIVVNGNNPHHPDAGISEDANNMHEFYRRFLGDDWVEKLEYPDNDENDLRSAIGNMVEKGVNDLSIYIVTHGGRDVLVMGNTSMTAQEFKNMLEEFPNVTFKIIIDACHSGSFVDDLDDLENVAIVLTATDADKSSYGDIDDDDDPNPEDTGGEWTSGFLEDLIEYTSNYDIWSYIISIAYEYQVSEKVVLYWYAWESAWDLDYARIRGLSNPQRSSEHEFPGFPFSY